MHPLEQLRFPTKGDIEAKGSYRTDLLKIMDVNAIL